MTPLMASKFLVLIDKCSSHNILQPWIASHLKLPIQPISPFLIMVDNNERINCVGLCKDVPLHVNNHTSTLPFYLLPIQGVDVIFDIKWLWSLGLVIVDFSIPQLSFTHNSTIVAIQGNPNTQPTHVSYPQLCHYIYIDSIASFHLLNLSQNHCLFELLSKNVQNSTSTTLKF